MEVEKDSPGDIMLTFFVKGGPVMYPLLVCSVTALTVIIERAIFWLRERRSRAQGLVDKILELAERDDYVEAARIGSGSKDYVARILICGIVHRNFSLSSALEMAAAVEIERMKRFMNVLDTMVTVSPLLGILGTVTGIIRSFEAMGVSGAQNPVAVSGGIAEALITTAAGLMIAIPSLAFFNYFNARIEGALHEIETYSTSLEIVHEKNKANNGPER
jgi:biopolymer transport protein ExbB